MNAVIDRLNFPKTVIRGKGAIAKLGDFCQTVGKKAFIFGGKIALSKTQDAMTKSLVEAGVKVLATEWYGGESSRKNIEALKEKAKILNADVLIAVGGGKALDTGKLVSYEAGIPLITIPTIAATCAAVTPVSVEYTDEGKFAAMTVFDYCPEGIIVDTDVILHAPVQYLAAGLGDTIAKWYEYRVSIKTMEENSITLGALTQGKLCFDLIERFGSDAINAVKAGKFDNALDSAIDSIILYAGLASILGGEKLRSAAAHGFYNGFTTLPGGHELSHGLTVGYGNLFLLALEKRPDSEIMEAVELCRKCGVPVSIEDIRSLNEEELKTLAKAITKTPDMKNMPFVSSEDDIIAAIKKVESLVKSNK